MRRRLLERVYLLLYAYAICQLGGIRMPVKYLGRWNKGKPPAPVTENNIEKVTFIVTRPH